MKYLIEPIKSVGHHPSHHFLRHREDVLQHLSDMSGWTIRKTNTSIVNSCFEVVVCSEDRLKLYLAVTYPHHITFFVHFRVDFVAKHYNFDCPILIYRSKRVTINLLTYHIFRRLPYTNTAATLPHLLILQPVSWRWRAALHFVSNLLLCKFW